MALDIQQYTCQPASLSVYPVIAHAAKVSRLKNACSSYAVVYKVAKHKLVLKVKFFSCRPQGGTALDLTFTHFSLLPLSPIFLIFSFASISSFAQHRSASLSVAQRRSVGSLRIISEA